jgi:hypothetical protein
LPVDTKSVSVGCGSGFALDRIQPAIDLAASGRVEYLSFDALAERTLALAHVRRLADADAGHDPRTVRTVDSLAPYVAENGLKVVGSFGGANVGRALTETVDRFRVAGISGVRVAAIEGDDVLDLVRERDPLVPGLGVKVSDLGQKLVSANCYLGAAPVVEALESGAQWVIGGRISDASLFVGPICHAMGWDLDDFGKVAHATLAGHILECSVQATGGYFADPPYREVDGLDRLGFPIAEVSEDSVEVSKLPDAGGLVNQYTVGLQIAYEVHDPARYMTPDVIADFTHVTLEEVGPDLVRATGARGASRPERLKVLLGVASGYRAIGEISYAGRGCVDRAKLASESFERTIADLESEIAEIRYDLIGVNALVGEEDAPEPREVRLRVAARCESLEVSEAITQEVERLYIHGPAGGGGVTRSVTPAIYVYPIELDAGLISTNVETVET